MNYRNFLYILIFLITASCSYEKVLKSTDYQMKYNKAYDYYINGDYVKAATVYEQVSAIYRGTKKADTIEYYKAKCYYNTKDYTMAGHYFKELWQTYPNGPFSEDAYFMGAYCLYKLSPRPSLDQANTYAAIDGLTLFAIQYPLSPKIEESKKLILELTEKLVEKSYISAKLYYNLSNYKAAIIALRNSLNDYPNTKYREELMFLLLRSSYLLAVNSIPDKQKDRYQAAVDEYYSFITEFPQGKHTAEAKDIYTESTKRLGDTITQN